MNESQLNSNVFFSHSLRKRNQYKMQTIGIHTFKCEKERINKNKKGHKSKICFVNMKGRKRNASI